MTATDAYDADPGAPDAAPDAADAALDDFVMRLERAADQLRSGELSADAAATLVEDCAALASQASIELERRAREAQREPLPGQDSLL